MFGWRVKVVNLLIRHNVRPAETTTSGIRWYERDFVTVMCQQSVDVSSTAGRPTRRQVNVPRRPRNSTQGQVAACWRCYKPYEIWVQNRRIKQMKWSKHVKLTQPVTQKSVINRYSFYPHRLHRLLRHHSLVSRPNGTTERRRTETNFYEKCLEPVEARYERTGK